MQLPSDCLPALRFGPGPDDAKCTTRPGSADTAKSTVSGGPGSRDAKRVRLGKRVETKKQAGSYELGNQTQFLASLSPFRCKPNKRLLHIAGLADVSLYEWCEPGCVHPRTNQARSYQIPSQRATPKRAGKISAHPRCLPLYKGPPIASTIPPFLTSHPRSHRSTTASSQMGRKGRKARVSRDADADGSEEEGAAAPAATGSKSLYEVRRPPNPSWDLGQPQGGRLRAGLGLVAVLVRRSNPVTVREV